jgi:hypothetical protein
MTILPESEKSRLQEIISKTTGPAPWYWKNFPVLKSASGKEYEWVHHGEEGQLAHLVTLHEGGKRNEPLLALNIYCTPFEIGEGRLGIWCPEGRNMIRVVAFELGGLKPFVFEEIVGWFRQSTERIFAKVEPSADFEFSAELNEGMQELSVPEELRGVKELPVIARRGTIAEDDAACAIFVLYPHAGLVEVLPQRWFHRKKFDVGRHWITRLTRDPVSHRIIGDGVKIPAFRLSENGREVDGWLE